MWSGLPHKADFGGLTGDVAEGPKTHSCAAASRPIRSSGRLAAIWRWASFEHRRLGFRSTTTCSWDNSPRPSAGEKLSLLSAKVVEVDPCQTLDKLDVLRFWTLPGGQHTASVSRLPASGGDCGTSSMRGRLWLSTSVGRHCWCARRIGSSGTSPAALSGTVRRLKYRLGASWQRRSASPEHTRWSPWATPGAYGTGEEIKCISLNYDWIGCPSYRSTTARSSPHG